MKPLKIGVMPYEKMKERAIAIARGQYKPGPDEPKIWFNSIKAVANVLSEENQALLQIILDHAPNSITELERLTGRKVGNLSRTLHTMERYGIVRLEKVAASATTKKGRSTVKPVVEAGPICLNVWNPRSISESGLFA